MLMALENQQDVALEARMLKGSCVRVTLEQSQGAHLQTHTPKQRDLNEKVRSSMSYLWILVTLVQEYSTR